MQACSICLRLHQIFLTEKQERTYEREKLNPVHAWNPNPPESIETCTRFNSPAGVNVIPTPDAAALVRRQPLLYLYICTYSATIYIYRHYYIYVCCSLIWLIRWQVSLLSQIYQSGRLAGSYRCWFMKKYCWLVCVREKYCFGWKFTIVYDKPQPNKQAVLYSSSTQAPFICS